MGWRKWRRRRRPLPGEIPKTRRGNPHVRQCVAWIVKWRKFLAAIWRRWFDCAAKALLLWVGASQKSNKLLITVHIQIQCFYVALPGGVSTRLLHHLSFKSLRQIALKATDSIVKLSWAALNLFAGDVTKKLLASLTRDESKTEGMTFRYSQVSSERSIRIVISRLAESLR